MNEEQIRLITAKLRAENKTQAQIDQVIKVLEERALKAKSKRGQVEKELTQSEQVKLDGANKARSLYGQPISEQPKKAQDSPKSASGESSIPALTEPGTGLEPENGSSESPETTDSEREITAYNTIKSRYKRDDQSDGEFWEELKPVKYQATKREAQSMYGTILSDLPKEGMVTYGGVKKSEDSVKYLELKYLHDIHERAGVTRSRKAGEAHKSLSDIEVLQKNEGYKQEIKDYESDPSLTYSYNNFVTYSEDQNAELIASFKDTYAQSIAPLVDRQERDRSKLVDNKLRAEYEDIIMQDLQDPNSRLGMNFEAIKVKYKDIQNPSTTDERRAELQSKFIEEVNALTQDKYSSLINKDPAYMKLVAKQLVDIDTETERLFGDFAKNIKPNITALTEDRLITIGDRLDEVGFAYANAPDKKKILEITLQDIVRGLPDLSDQGVLDVKNEFWNHFYTKLQESPDGGPSQFVLKDVAQETLEYTNTRREELIATESERLRSSGYEPKRRKGLVVSIEEQAAMNVVKSEEGRVLELAKVKAEDVISNPEFKHDMGFWDGVTSNRGYKYMPVFGGIVDMSHLWRIKTAQDKAPEDRSKSDDTLLGMSAIEQQSNAIKREVSENYNAGAILGDMMPYMGEFILTGGIFTATKSAVKTGLKQTLAKKITGSAKTRVINGKWAFVKKGAGVKISEKTIDALAMLTGVGAQNASQWWRISGGLADNMTDEMLWSYSSDADSILDELSLVPVVAGEEGAPDDLEDGDNFSKAFLKSFGTNYAELFTERLGAYMPGLGKKGLNLMKTKKGPLGNLLADSDWLKRVSLGHFLRKVKFDNVNDFMQWSRKTAGWNGILQEITEELINFPMQNVINGDPTLLGIYNYNQDGTRGDVDWRGLRELTKAMSVSGLVFGAGAVVHGSATGRKAPTYYIKQRKFETWAEAKAYLKKMKKSEITSDLDIEIRNDYMAYDEAADILKKAGVEEDIIKTRGAGVSSGELVATEVEILNAIESKETREELESIDAKIAALEKEKTSVTGGSDTKSAKNKALANIQNSISELKIARDGIIKPISDSIAKRKKTARYEDILNKIKAINESLPEDKRVIIDEDVSTLEEYKAKMTEAFLAQAGYKVLRYSSGGYVKGQSADGKSYVEISTGEVVVMAREAIDQIDEEIKKQTLVHGYIDPGVKGKPSRMVLNRAAALSGDGANVASHEFLHFMLEGIFQGNPEVALAVGETFKGYIYNLDPKQIRDTGFRNRVLTYQADYGDAVSAEESMNIFVDAIANGTMQYNEGALVKIGDVIRRVLQSFGKEVVFENGQDVFNFLRDYSDGVAKGHLSKGLKKAFNTEGIEVKGGMIASKEIAAEGIENSRKLNLKLAETLGFTEEEFKEVYESNIHRRRSSKEPADLKERFDRHTQVDGKPKFESKEDFMQSPEFMNAYQDISETNSLDGLIKADMAGLGLPSGSAEVDFIQSVRERLIERFIKNYDPSMANGSLFGWLTGEAGGGMKGGMIFRSKQDIKKAYLQRIKTLDSDASLGDNVTYGDMQEADADVGVEAFEEADLSIGSKGRSKSIVDSRTSERGVVFVDSIDLESELIDKIHNIIRNADIDLNGLDYRGVKEFIVEVADIILENGKKRRPSKESDVKALGPLYAVLEVIGEKFDVPAARILAGQNLTSQSRKNAQKYIKENATQLMDMIPDSGTRSGTSTGVASSWSLGDLFTKGKRVSSALGEGTQGRYNQDLNIFRELDEEYSQDQIDLFLGLFGITPDGGFSTDRNLDSPIRALVTQAAAIVANQTLRQQGEESRMHPVSVINLVGVGKSNIMYSMESDVNLENFKITSEKVNGVIREMATYGSVLNNPSKAADAVAEKLGIDRSEFNEAVKIVKAEIKEIKVQQDKSRIRFSKEAPKKMSEIIETGAKKKPKKKKPKKKAKAPTAEQKAKAKAEEKAQNDEKNLDIKFNNIIQDVTGMGAKVEINAARANKDGKGKGDWKFFIPPSAEDFEGLVYSFIGKGKEGEAHQQWFKQHLFDPFSRGIRRVNTLKQAVNTDLVTLKRDMPKVNKRLKTIAFNSGYSVEDAIRIYNWKRAGFEVPGLSSNDAKLLNEFVSKDKDLVKFANRINAIAQRPGGIAEPSDYWHSGTIASDMYAAVQKHRSTILDEWITNKDIIFSKENLNKIEAVYGRNFRVALVDVLERMQLGTNSKNKNPDQQEVRLMRWINGSVGATMFLNSRSAVLQLLSTVNFVNWGDNNPLKAAKVFANQPRYWGDVAMIFNSGFLKQRRSGLAHDINASELAEAVNRANNPFEAAIGFLLKIGFTPTQAADSLAIALGGATFYRNRINTYVKEGSTQAEAEKQSFLDMMELAEKTQQSSREDRVSKQQASSLGKFFLSFQNTPMQYNRLIKKAFLDLKNRRGDPKEHISRILYYSTIQNAIFYTLQTALHAAMFGDDDDEIDSKTERVVNGMIDSLLRGSGMVGGVIAMLKNTTQRYLKERAKGYQGDMGAVVVELTNVVPPIGIKIRKIYKALNADKFNKDVMSYMPYTDLDNPIYEATTSLVEGATNIPVNRLYHKVSNLVEAMDSDLHTMTRLSLGLGWSKWNLGIGSESVDQAKEAVKLLKSYERKNPTTPENIEKARLKEYDKALEKAAEEKILKDKFKKEQDSEKKAGKKDITCSGVSSTGERCSLKTKGKSRYCTIHEKVKKNSTGKKSQCKHRKKDNTRCKVMTSNASGKCYYHD